jgi:peroxiredoxin
MSIALVTARLVLFAVFVVAGGSKLADQLGTRKALVGFGIPDRLSGPLALALPLAELAIALALVPEASAWPAGIAAVTLLGAFLTAIGINLAHGRRPDCHCFGQIHSAPIGPSTVLLNLTLLAIAACIIAAGALGQPMPSMLAWVTLLQPAQQVALGGGLLALLLLAAIAALLWQVLLQQGRLLLRLDQMEARLMGDQAFAEPMPMVEPPFDPSTMGAGLPVGERAPAFELPAIEGKRIALQSLLRKQKPILMFFTHPNCGPCVALLPQIAQWQRELASSHTVAVISEGSKKDNEKKIAPHGIGQLLLQRERELAESYQAWGTPAAVLIAPDGIIASRVAQGAERIHTLVAWATSPLSAPVAGGNARAVPEAVA